MAPLPALIQNDYLVYFSLCIDCRAETLILKNMKEAECKFKTEANCVS